MPMIEWLVPFLHHKKTLAEILYVFIFQDGYGQWLTYTPTIKLSDIATPPPLVRSLYTGLFLAEDNMNLNIFNKLKKVCPNNRGIFFDLTYTVSDLTAGFNCTKWDF